MKKKIPKKQLALLQAGRLKWASLAKADKFWRAFSELCNVSPEHRTAVIERLRKHASDKPQHRAIVDSLAKALR